MPECVGLVEECTEADGHGGGDGPSPVNNLVDGARHVVLRNARGLKALFEQDFVGGDGCGRLWVSGCDFHYGALQSSTSRSESQSSSDSSVSSFTGLPE